ncbi:hypothetical protein VPH35_136530 [Triticum aestivum]|uniref:uncharacterized protein n=1 Tax=Triticum aestivum TaxID=4565 RepID=UPI001D023677|nr:uncharacterized protein LOC123171016 [Triticum aestivum]
MARWYCKSTRATTDSAVREVAYDLDAAGQAGGSVVAVGSPEMQPLGQGPASRGQLCDLPGVSSSGASCTTLSSGGGGVAEAGSGDGARTVELHSPVQSYSLGDADPGGFSGVGVGSPEMQPLDRGPTLRGRGCLVPDVESSGASCTTFSSGARGVASAGSNDGARTVDSCSAVQSYRPGVPTATNTTIRVGWKRRPRGPRSQDEKAGVVDRVPALEAAIRGFADRGTEVVVNPALGTVIDSLAEADEFYNLYSWEVGFGIRYGKSRQNVNGTKCMQEMVCGCAVSFCILFFPGLND